MTHLIDKDALVAEIGKLFERAGNSLGEYRNGAEHTLISLKDSIDTLEVKEVDLCKEEERIWKDFNMAECHLSKNDLKKIAKRFFELGMQVSNKAQKGE